VNGPDKDQDNERCRAACDPQADATPIESSVDAGDLDKRHVLSETECAFDY